MKWFARAHYSFFGVEGSFGFASALHFLYIVLELKDNKIEGIKTRISVVIVTYNRPEEVKEAIDSLENQSVRPLEVIIIDDASTPPLRMEVDGSRIKLIRFDKEVGASNARNFGIKIAKGEYIAFIDDDAIACKHWIEEIQKGIRAGAEVLGGPLRPRFKAKPPKWWSEKYLGYFVGVGNSEKREIWGANMAFKREVFKKIGVFNPKLGPQKGKHLCREDTQLIAKAEARFKVLFMPNAEVYHTVRPERLTLSYIIRWAYIYGKSQKIAYGRPNLFAFYGILKAMIALLNPFVRSEKSAKIQKIATIAERVGTIV